ncbi:MAG: polysaccharide pyruvyl transferase family protein [Mesorhizobium sp.]
MTDSARQILEQALAAHAGGAPYAIIDYPGYANPGDAAIWCGARRVLETVTGCTPSYVSTLRHFDPGRCRRAVPGGTVFFLGGGSFGSLYEKHHRMRLRALERIGDARIVLLPLSVAEDAGKPDATALAAETRRILAGCARLTAYSRERRSQATLRDVYGIEASLCPDTAHAVTPPVVVPVQERLALFRRDGEALGTQAGDAAGSDQVVDWPDDASLRWINRAGKIAPLFPSHRLRLAAFDLVARKKVEAACRLLGQGRIVATDRLHGVILASLMGRRVIASENATGKVGSYVETWSGMLPDVTFGTGEA